MKLLVSLFHWRANPSRFSLGREGRAGNDNAMELLVDLNPPIGAT
jgi:hypothetical protein